jgi:hypothetical protein
MGDGEATGILARLDGSNHSNVLRAVLTTIALSTTRLVTENTTTQRTMLLKLDNAELLSDAAAKESNTIEISACGK